MKHASSRLWFMYANALLSVKPSNVAIWIFERKQLHHTITELVDFTLPVQWCITIYIFFLKHSSCLHTIAKKPAGDFIITMCMIWTDCFATGTGNAKINIVVDWIVLDCLVLDEYVNENLRILKECVLYLFCQCVSISCFKLHQSLFNTVGLGQWHYILESSNTLCEFVTENRLYCLDSSDKYSMQYI